MFSSFAEMAKRERHDHPSGPLETVDEIWKARVRAAMDELGWDQKDLATKCSVSPASITNLFKPGPRQIRFKSAVHRALKWPDANKLDDGLRRISDNWRHLSEAQRDAILALVDSVASKP